MAGVMKDSEVEWIGEIPEGWDISKVKYIGRYINGYAFKPDQWGQDGLPIIRIQNLSGSSESINYFDGKISDDYLIDDGDILISWSATLDAFIWNYGKGWLNQHIFKAIPNVQKTHKSYFFHLMKIAMLNMSSDKHGSAMQHVTNQIFGNFQVPLPSLSEQKLIADFLDEKCAEIDNLSEDIQKQIDILNDYKKSVITRAVTKGLNPNVKKKDSGQLHIGDIPEEWEIVRVKDVFKMQSGFTPDSKRTDYYDDVNGFNWVTIADINKKSDLPETTKSKISKKYIEAFHPRMAKAGSLLYSFKLSIGQVAFVKKDTYTNEAIISFSCKDTRNLRFLKYSSSLIEYNANTNIYGSKILNQQLIGNAHITLPPIDEQDHIADYLDDFTAKMSDIIDEKSNQLEKIDLYKKSIIYEYVTGKKRVKGAL